VGQGLGSGGTISARCKITPVVCQLATNSLHESSPGRLSRNAQPPVRIRDTQSSCSISNHLSGQEKQDLARCFARPIWDANELLTRDLQMKGEELKVEH
jgi:hypothetical protein